MEYNGLRQVISGGQTGADQGALYAASEMIETGGFAPNGWKTSRGPDESLKKFGMLEHSASGYKPRTKKNVEISDATLIIASNFSSPGTVVTLGACKIYKKPFALIKVADGEPIFNVDELAEFIVFNSVSVLNVAGNRDIDDDHNTRKHHTAAFQVITKLMLCLDRLGMLIRKT